jgi:hypothetical protein
MNPTLIVHMAPGASVVPQLVGVVGPNTKPAETLIVIFVAAGPIWLVTVTVWNGLVVPTVTVPKSSVLGVTDSFAGLAACAVADPINAKRSRILSVRVTSADNLDRIMVGSSSDQSKHQ